jgi:hypothetical protein
MRVSIWSGLSNNLPDEDRRMRRMEAILNRYRERLISQCKSLGEKEKDSFLKIELIVSLRRISTQLEMITKTIGDPKAQRPGV